LRLQDPWESGSKLMKGALHLQDPWECGSTLMKGVDRLISETHLGRAGPSLGDKRSGPIQHLKPRRIKIGLMNF
jgi:hypothetical protein